MSVLRSKAVLTVIGSLAVIAAVIWCAWVTFGPDGGDQLSELAVATATPPATGQPQPPLALAETSPPARIVIPAIGVHAPVTAKTVGADHVMQSPDGPEDVAWYDFSAKPGSAGNSVFSGHVDYHDYGPAVFADVKELVHGDLIQVYSTDGAAYSYRVVVSTIYSADQAPVEDIIGATSRESVTLITCAGSFDPSTHQYSDRLIVRAERVQPSANAEG
jgi:LPXTG-site transpeptidase (sortase) family protein